MFNNLFGENYANKVDIFQNLYLRIMLLRGGIFDFPLLIFICYLIPWADFYHYSVVQQLIQFMESNTGNVADNRIYSDFPEYAVTYLSIIHTIGFMSLILPFIFSVESHHAVAQLEKNKVNPFKIIFCGLAAVAIAMFAHLYVGAVTYFGCEKCSYHHPLSLIVGAIVAWVSIHYFLVGTIIYFRAILLIKRSKDT